QAVPAGFAPYFPRYLLTTAVLILCATIAPLFAAIERRLPRRSASFALGAAVLLPMIPISDYAIHDKWMPIDYVRAVAHRANRRFYPPMPLRAAMVADHVAGPNDRIDVHGGHDTYLYPAYGASLTREVYFVTRPADVRPDAQWVVIDRADNIFWHHPAFKSAEDWRRYWGRGQP